jgi:hypothetical protein
MGDNVFHIPLHKESLDQFAAKDRVFHFVITSCPASLGNKPVLMNPLAIGASFLRIHETVRRMPDCDFRLSADWGSPDFQFVIQERSSAEDVRSWCQNFEL